MPAAPQLTDADRALFAAALMAEAQRSQGVPWEEFIRHVFILNDDPDTPRPIKFEPYDYQTETFNDWIEGGDHLTLKARQIGFSWMVAAYMLWRAMYNGWAVGYYSRGDEESKHELAHRVRFIFDRLPDNLKRKGNFIENLASFETGGSIRAFPGTQTAGVGYTFQLVVFDEFAMHKYGAENYAAVVSTTGAGGQILVMSTSNPALGPAGAFYDLWMAQGSRFKRRFWGWNVVPARDEAWYKRELLRHPGDERSFRAFNPSSIEDAFAGKGLLVYADFNEALHMKPGKPWNSYRYRLTGVDWGGAGDPAAVSPMGVTRDEFFHIPGEFLRNSATTVKDIGDYLFRLHNVAPFDIIACGVDEPVATASLRAMGLPAYPAITKRIEGIGLVQMLFRENRITIDPACKQTRYQLLTYQNRLLTDPNTRERYPTRTPVDHHGDIPDCIRYAAMAYWAKAPRQQGGIREMVLA